MTSRPELTEFLLRLDEKRSVLSALAASDGISVAAVLVDEVTELVELLSVADEELRDQHAQLTETRTRLEALLARDAQLSGHHGEALVVTDDHGIVLDVNSAALAALNAESARIVGAPLAGRFVTEHRRALRTLVARSRVGDDLQRGRAALPDDAGDFTVDITGFDDPVTGRRRLRWQLTPVRAEAAPVLRLVPSGLDAHPTPRSTGPVLTAGELFSGSGETQVLLRRLDWAATPLGPVQGWAPALVAAVRTVLSSKIPMLIWWGPDLVQLYNDAFIQFAGDKHPLGLGQPARDAWPEIWTVVGPLAQAVLAGVGATYAEDELLFMDRAGYSEETYWTFSYSPISDGTDDVAGVLVATTDVTQLVLTSRRLQVAGELRTLSAAQLQTPGRLAQAAMDRLSDHREDLPFAAMYLADDTGAHLVASYGLDPAGPPLPARVDLAEDSPVSRVLRGGPAERSDELGPPFPSCWFLPGPLGSLTPQVVCTLPVRIAGTEERPYAVITVAMNPYLYPDRDYFSFLSQLAHSLGVVLTDIEAYEAERLRAERLAELDAAKTRFFENVSHELRTPLTLMSAPIDRALADPELSLGPDHRADLEAAQRAVLRLRQLVDSLLESSRAGTEEGRPVPADVDPAALTADLTGMFSPAVAAAGLTLTVDTDSGAGSMLLDADAYARILLNLLSNAMKYTVAGGITVRLSRDGDDLVLTVADTGLGVAEPEREAIFDRFHHVEVPGARSQDGTGIGLSLVRDLAVAHGGSVTLTGSSPAGSTFTVRLAPLPRPDIAPATSVLDPAEAARPFVTAAMTWTEPAAAEHDDHAGTDAPTSGRVLVVEDNADMRGYLTRLLRRDGWDVEAVTSVEEALSVAVMPELVLSDVMLPGTTGVELVSMLRSQPALARIPCILLTARAGRSAATEGLRAGADDYIVKPFDPDELLARVRTHHELSRLRELAVHKAEERAEHLTQALSTNRKIGTAIGILMQQLKITEDQAFELLRKSSQNRHRKLRDVADEVVTTGSAPPAG